MSSWRSSLTTTSKNSTVATDFQRILALDYGTVRVGVAISDPLGMLARRLETIERQGSDAKVIARVQELCQTYGVKQIVLGLPLRTDDLPGEREADTRRFGADLAQATGLEIIWQDERYSSLLAEEIMRQTKVKEKDRKKVIDQIAAEIILQDYLNSLG